MRKFTVRNLQVNLSTWDLMEKALENRYSRMVANNTELFRWTDEEFQLRLHGHTIASIDKAGWVQIDSCRYQTSTTKNRLNAVLHSRGWVLFQRDWDWYVQRIGKWDEEPIPFSDGMILFDDGRACDFAGMPLNWAPGQVA